jgi:hypothetical protein
MSQKYECLFKVNKCQRAVRKMARLSHINLIIVYQLLVTIKMSIAEFAAFYINGQVPENVSAALFEDFRAG